MTVTVLNTLMSARSPFLEAHRCDKRPGDREAAVHDLQRQRRQPARRGAVHDLAAVLRIENRKMTRALDLLLVLPPLVDVTPGVRADRRISDDAVRRARARLGRQRVRI